MSKSSFSSSGFNPDDRPFPILEYYSNLLCKQKTSCLDTQDVIVTTSPSVAKPSIVLTTATPVFSLKLLEIRAFSTGSSAEVSRPSRKRLREEESSLVASHPELMIAHEVSEDLVCPVQPGPSMVPCPVTTQPSRWESLPAHLLSSLDGFLACLAWPLRAIPPIPIAHLPRQLSLLMLACPLGTIMATPTAHLLDLPPSCHAPAQPVDVAVVVFMVQWNSTHTLAHPFCHALILLLSSYALTQAGVYLFQVPVCQLCIELPLFSLPDRHVRSSRRPIWRGELSSCVPWTSPSGIVWRGRQTVIMVKQLLPPFLGNHPPVIECLQRRTGGQPSLPCRLLVARRLYTVWGSPIWLLVAVGLSLQRLGVDFLASYLPSAGEMGSPSRYSKGLLSSNPDTFSIWLQVINLLPQLQPMVRGMQRSVWWKLREEIWESRVPL